jgi:hypothetical protein
MSQIKAFEASNALRRIEVSGVVSETVVRAAAAGSYLIAELELLARYPERAGEARPISDVAKALLAKAGVAVDAR